LAKLSPWSNAMRAVDPPTPRSSLVRVAAFGAHILGVARWRAAAAIGFLILAGLTEGLSLLMLAPIVKLVSEGPGRIAIPLPAWAMALTGPISLGLAAILALLVAVIALRGALMRLKDIYMVGLLCDLSNTQRVSLFRSIGQARWRLLASLRGSDLEHALTGDIDRIHSGAMQFLLLVQAAFLLGVYCAASLIISPIMTAIAAAIGVTALLVMRPIRKRATAYGEALTARRQDQYRTVSEFVTGVKVAKSFNAEPVFVAKLASTLDWLLGAAVNYTRISSIGAFAFQAASVSGLAIFVYLAIERYHLSFAALMVLILIFMRVAPRFMELQTYMQGVLTSLGAFDALRSLQARCEADREVVAGPQAPAPRLERAVRFAGVSFRYGSETAVLHDLSFELPANQITAVIGASGGGKSTLADLLLGLLEPTSGQVLVDGTPLDASNRRAWRDQLAYVPQEVFLLHDTIAENLRIAAPGASEAELWEALGQAGAEAFVRRLPDGLTTVVGDRGLRLSGGERQRVALARALLRRPALLILDEATSALDWENQMLIARSIQALRGRMTIVTIAHRPSMITFADRILAIEEGRIVENGGFGEVMNAPRSRLGRLMAAEQRNG
jgi:ATP-binding cassette, subfamily C, bacterial